MRIQIGWNESKKDGAESWVHFGFHLQVNPVLSALISYFGSVWGLVSPCGQSFVDVALCNLLFNICITERFVWLPVIYTPLPPLLLLLPTWSIVYFVRRKALLEIAYFINCLVTQRGWMLYSCLIYFENFATELTLINELSVVSNKLCVGCIDWEGF